MIESKQLLAALKSELKVLLGDLTARVDTEEAFAAPLRAEWESAVAAQRTAWSFSQWLEDRLTQVAVGWLVGSVFVRFCEDNALLDDALLAGPGARGDEAKAAQLDFFRANPHGSDRDYLHHVFRSAARAPGLAELVGEAHAALWLADPPADACSRLLGLWRSVDDAGGLVFDFTDPELDTRFLGDLYQDLSEHAQKTYALLQTPVFVEEFILDRTLDPAVDTFGLAEASVIDPTCGSGHFLLGSFARLLTRWRDAEPATPATVVVQKTLDAVWGVDLNPFAAAIARFRLLVAALDASGIKRLADAPGFTIHVAVGDSLLWGATVQELPGLEGAGGDRRYLYATEDAHALRATFGRTYSAVVGNPPYIVPKDPAANTAYRRLYASCSGKYSLGVPFTELFFELATPANPSTAQPAGYVGMITANSFMKRQMGKKLIENYLPTVDLTHVIDTSGAYIPGHGIPTVMLLGRHQGPVTDTVRTVLGIRGEPTTPPDPSHGLVWTAITTQVDQPHSESAYISTTNTARTRFATHPWSIGGGGAAELAEALGATASSSLGGSAESVGITSFTLEDDVFLMPPAAATTRRLTQLRAMVEGERIRDFTIADGAVAVFPYDHQLNAAPPEVSELKHLWPFRVNLSNNKMFGQKTKVEAGLAWYEFGRLTRSKLMNPLSIAFASVATHNHFVLDRGGKVFNRSAPVIKLPEGATVDEHLGLLGLLNSSTACFWMKQTFHGKGNGGIGGGIGDEGWEPRFDFDGTKMQSFPLPSGERPVAYGQRLDDLAQALSAVLPVAVVAETVPSRERLDAARVEAERMQAEMVTWQEELDWHCLWLYGLTPEALTVPDGHTPPPLQLGERAFEIVLARQMAAGHVETEWFRRHRSTPITDPPAHWPDWYTDLVNQRIALIESDRNIELIERPENKRRWNRTPWPDLETAALRDWLLDRLEAPELWFDQGRAVCRSLAQLADRIIATNPDWLGVAHLWAGRIDLDPTTLVTQLVADEHVPAQPAARYKPSGLVKRRDWENTWALQRREDAGEDVGVIPVPPKYTQGDFQKTSYWRQRGKLDVPKERFVSIPGAERDPTTGDPTLTLAWAGFDHAQLAQAIATLLHQRQATDGWNDHRLLALCVALDQQLDWVDQWHPDPDPTLGQPLATFYRNLLTQTLTTISATTTDLTTWQPPTPTRGRTKKAAATTPSSEP